ncbi:MAG TPA: hypothetical protein DEB10_05935 [Ruminococcaceae bacterium]|nr:hypothetical protein [Oscillospiraceae bacterium]HCA28237.1 hypothetical protein [Oscillospiraceae bacterium]
MGIFPQSRKGCGRQVRSFSTFHPVSFLIYFICVIVIVMFAGNPVFYILSLIGAVGFYAFQAKRRFWHDLLFYILAFIIIALANPLLSHKGMTILFFLNDNPITFEAIAYGVALAAMMIATLCWFQSFSVIMTSDKLFHLFGRAVPGLSIILSSALRYIPLFRSQSKKIMNLQTAMGLYSKGSYIDGASGTMRVFSAMVTWSLENAIDTADSMKARGYGQPGRTLFSIFRFRLRDLQLIIVSVILFAITILGIAFGYSEFSFYPKLSTISVAPEAIICYAAYGLFALLPLLYEIKENIRWIYCKSKI